MDSKVVIIIYPLALSLKLKNKILKLICFWYNDSKERLLHNI